MSAEKRFEDIFDLLSYCVSVAENEGLLTIEEFEEAWNWINDQDVAYYSSKKAAENQS